jgi:GT2 family glycosyltransferase
MNISKKQSKVSISACIVNYNGEAYLKETLEAVFSQVDQFEEVILVDNASEDSSTHLANTLYPDLKIIRLRENRGPGAARNEGFKLSACDFILMLDNDISLGKNCAGLLVNALKESPGAALAMPSIRYDDRRSVIQYDGAGCHYLGLMDLQNEGNTEKKVIPVTRKLNSLVTACFAVDRRKITERNPFDESFFFNLEDHDFGLRTRILGFNILSVPSAVCFHRQGSAGLSYRIGNPYPKKRLVFLVRNRWQIILKNYHWKTLFLLCPIFITYEIFQMCGLARKNCFLDYMRCIGWVVLKMPEIRRKRRLIQKNRKTPDSELLHGGSIRFSEAFISENSDKMALFVLNMLVQAYWKFANKLI